MKAPIDRLADLERVILFVQSVHPGLFAGIPDGIMPDVPDPDEGGHDRQAMAGGPANPPVPPEPTPEPEPDPEPEPEPVPEPTPAPEPAPETDNAPTPMVTRGRRGGRS